MVYPELIVMVDYSLYQKFGFSLSATHQYVISYFNTVNFRYLDMNICFVYELLFPRFKSLSSPRVELSLVGIFIATSSSSLPYLHTSGYFSSIVDASNALDAMGKYYFYDRSNLPQYDLIVALTAQDMAAYKSGSYNTNTAGFAYVGGACVKNSR